MATYRRPKVVRSWLVKALRATADFFERTIENLPEQTLEPVAPSATKGTESVLTFASSDQPPAEWLRYVQERSALPDGSGAYAAHGEPAGSPSLLREGLATTRRWSQAVLRKRTEQIITAPNGLSSEHGSGRVHPTISNPPHASVSPGDATSSSMRRSRGTPRSGVSAGAPGTAGTIRRTNAAPPVDSAEGRGRDRVGHAQPSAPVGELHRLEAPGATPSTSGPSKQVAAKLRVRQAWFTTERSIEKSAPDSERSDRTLSSQGERALTAEVPGARRVRAADAVVPAKPPVPSRFESAAAPVEQTTQPEPVVFPSTQALSQRAAPFDQEVEPHLRRYLRQFSAQPTTGRDPARLSSPFSRAERTASSRQPALLVPTRSGEVSPAASVEASSQTARPARQQRLEAGFPALRDARFEQLLPQDHESLQLAAEERWPALPVRALNASAEPVASDWERQLLEEQNAC